MSIITIIIITIFFIFFIYIFIFNLFFSIFISRNITISTFKRTFWINFHISPNSKRFKFMFIRIINVISIKPFFKITIITCFIHSSIIIFIRNKINIIFYKFSCSSFLFINIFIIFWFYISINVIIRSIITVII